MTYHDLLERLKDIPEEYLDQDIEVVGECITQDYYDVDCKLSADEYSLEIILT